MYTLLLRISIIFRQDADTAYCHHFLIELVRVMLFVYSWHTEGRFSIVEV